MSKIVLGLDPGTATTGYGVVRIDTQSAKYIAHGCILTPAALPPAQRLNLIAQELTGLIAAHRPDLVAVEELFFYNNITTAMAVAQARGVLLQTAAAHNIDVRSFTPLQVKQAITGYGKADKKQIQKMITMILSLKSIPKPDDAADALAIAVTCAHSIPLFEATK